MVSPHNAIGVTGRGEGKKRGTNPLIPNLGAICKSVINITPRPQYPLGKSPGS